MTQPYDIGLDAHKDSHAMAFTYEGPRSDPTSHGTHGGRNLTPSDVDPTQTPKRCEIEGEDGGGCGIRTHGYITASLDFESSALNRAQPTLLECVSAGGKLAKPLHRSSPCLGFPKSISPSPKQLNNGLSLPQDSPLLQKALPTFKRWGLSATLGKREGAGKPLMDFCDYQLIAANQDKKIEIEMITLLHQRT